MNLPIPSTNPATAGPDYAVDINSCLTLIDAHDHTPGKGVQVTQDGLNINGDFSLNSHALTNVLSISFDPSGTQPTATNQLYVFNNELWFNDGVQPVQLTKNGDVNVTISSLVGEEYNAGTFRWTQAQDALPTTPASMDIGQLLLRNPTTGVLPSGPALTLKAPTLAGNYNLVLPIPPATGAAIVQVDSNGNMTANVITDEQAGASPATLQIAANVLKVKDLGITTEKIADGQITQAKRAALPVGTVSTASYTVNSGSYSSIVTTGSINSKGRPVILMLEANASDGYILVNSGTTAVFRITRSSGGVAGQPTLLGNYFTDTARYFPPGSLVWMDTTPPADSSITYTLEGKISSGSTAQLVNVTLIAYSL